MTKGQRAKLEQQAEALHASEGAGALAAIVGRGAWVRAHIPSEFLQDEPTLSASCWPEYLYLSPLDRTRRFTTEYLNAYKFYAKRMIDHRKVAHLCPVNELLEYNAATFISSLWRARQQADALCMPYQKYLFPLMQHALEEEGHTRLPLPNQLYDLAQIKHVVEDWTQSTRDVTPDTRDWDERLLAINYSGTLAQRHSHDVLINLVGNSVGRLEQFMLRDGLLPESVARARLGDELADRALDRHGSTRILPSPTPSTAYIRPCLGLLAIHGPACSGCPFAAQCERVSLAIDQELRSIYGSADPRADHKRELARDRQRRKRERDRERDSELIGDDPE